MELTWDGVGERFYENGVDHGVLYIPDEGGDYADGVAWNGLTAITEKPSGAEPNKQFADNIEYLNLFSAEQFAATLEAFTFPDEFMQFDGLAVPQPGVSVGQQTRKTFGIAYRTKKANDQNEDLGYKLHLVYGCKASPSEKAYATVNDSPEAIAFSWEISTTPALITGLKPTSILVIDSTTADADGLEALELVLYGDEATDPRLPTPDEVVALFSGSIVTLTGDDVDAPTYDAGTNTITIPTVTGVVYKIDGEPVTGGVVIVADTVVTATPEAGYVFGPTAVDEWFINFT